MGLGGVAIAALPSMIHPKLSFSDSLGGVESKSQQKKQEKKVGSKHGKSKRNR